MSRLAPPRVLILDYNSTPIISVMSMSISPQLIHKYNVAGPRYTSYPTVPYWQEADFSVTPYLETVKRTFSATNARDGISLYIHLPYCESLCTFCACNHRITKKHEVETGYIAAVLKEWRMYVDLLAQSSDERIKIREIHLGGGTPTFFAPEKLADLINGLFEFAERADNHEFSFEGHPNNTTEAHLQTLYDLGFRRVSFGVQDYDAKVQKAINRIQPFENVARVTETARAIGYTSISHDLVFGLPHQNLDTMRHTIAKTAELSPDRLAFYSYAHVPWIKGNGQRGFKDHDVPKDEMKRQCYEEGKKKLLEQGYHEIGMDHFALQQDPMYQSFQAGTLHRNFMGYTASKTQVMIGLGVSSISDSWYSFAQNEKNIDDYYVSLEQEQIPVYRGHVLSDEDLVIRKHILNLMCSFETSWSEPKMDFPELNDVLNQLNEMQHDQLLVIGDESIRVTEAGKPFVRNICMAFDLKLKRKMPESRIFSMTI